MSLENRSQSLSFGELSHINGLIALMQERGVGLGDLVKAQSDVCCCGAITCEAKGKIVFNEHDREIIRQIAELENQLELSPTLGDLVELRGELLRAQLG
jgi:hypothetical protein